MAISTQKAKALCTATEFQLVQASTPQRAKSLTPSQLKQKIDRARKLRDKYRDLAKKQRGEARGKRKPTGTRPAKGNERTVEKAQLFQETLGRFQEADQRVTASTVKATRKAATKSKTAKKAAAKSKTAKKTGATKTAKRAQRETSVAQEDGSPLVAEPPSRGPTSGAEAGSPFALTGPGTPLSSVAIAGEPLGPNPVFGGASAFGRRSEQKSRNERRREASQSSKIGREQNRFSRTGREQIQGHVSARTRRAQARRDAK
jgi:hypothetical protein